MRRPLRVLLVGVALIAGTTASAQGVHAAASDTQVLGAGLTSNAASLSGTGLAVLTVSVHLTDPTGVDTGPGYISDIDGLSTCPCALLQVSPDPSAHGGTGFHPVALGRVSGTVDDGIWAGSVTVGAAEAGTWALVDVIAGTFREPQANGPDWKAVDGTALGASLQITGSNWPVLTIAPITPVPYGSRYVVRGKLTLKDTGAGAPYTLVQVETPPILEYFPRTLLTTSTDVDGNWSVTSTVAAEGVRALFDANDMDPGPWQVYQGSIRTIRLGRTQHWNVYLTPRSSGSWHYLDVSLLPRQQTTVQLQRLVNGVWTPLVSHLTASTGTYRFATQRLGCYRVRALQNEVMAPYTSRTVCLT